MPAPFTHLHVASGYSLRYGASMPSDLVARAAELGMSSLALTDRDGLYGAVKFVQACLSANLAPILGADLAVEPSGLTAGLPRWAVPTDRPEPGPTGHPPARRVPARGGASVDPRHPRVTVLALAGDRAAGIPAGAGWAQLCRLVTATHLRGERSRPVTTLDLIAQHTALDTGDDAAPALLVLLGPASEVGQAALAGRPDVARAVLDRWRRALPPAAIAVEVVHHRSPTGSVASRQHAARMLTLARDAGVPAVLTNAVRHTDRDGAVTVDVLDAARRLVALDSRHLDRTTAEGYLAGPDDMAARAREIADSAGIPGAADDLLHQTQILGRRCHLDPHLDLGLGDTHLPEPEALGLTDDREVDILLAQMCHDQLHTRYPHATRAQEQTILGRLQTELTLIASLEMATYFLTVARVCTLFRGDLGIRVAARGSGAGSLVNFLLGISGVDPIRHDLLMERFLGADRMSLPDIDIDVESDRRLEAYEAILTEFGADRVTCVSMMDTYRARHSIRDVGATLGLPPAEIDAIAKAFPHIRARDVRQAIATLPELRRSGLGQPRLELLFNLVERLDGLPRHVALHPCGVIISNTHLMDRTPVEASWQGLPMSQFDKDDVEAMGLLKLDVLGIRMQSAMSYAIAEIARVDGPQARVAGRHDPDAEYMDDSSGLIDLDAVPLDDEATFRLIRTTHTLGCFQIESPGQRELVGKFGPATFLDLIIDISLFRPGPVKSDMITPFLRGRQDPRERQRLHPLLEETLDDTSGVVVFHEQVLRIIAITTGCTLTHADEVRRRMGSPEGQAEVEQWFRASVRTEAFDPPAVQRIWEVLKAFASFGFCKAHAAAFALPTYQSAWLKTHHPAAFLAGVLTHDPGMYPKRLILDDARNLGVSVLPLDVNHSDSTYRVERITKPELPPAWAEDLQPPSGHPDLPDGSAYGIRLALSDVKGISGAEVSRIEAGRPYQSLADFWHRAQVSRPIVERLVLVGGFDTIYGLSDALPVPSRHRITRRDLLLQLGDLERWTKATTKPAAGRSRPGARRRSPSTSNPSARVTADPTLHVGGVRAAAGRQSQAPRAVLAPQDQSPQMALDLGDEPDQIVLSGLPEMSRAELVRAELDILGLDASQHVLDFYAPLLTALGITWARDIRDQRNRAELLVAGVKVATQTPPIRTGKRVLFLTIDDSTGPVDATFFEDAQGPYAGTVFHSWLLLVRGVLRRTGAQGASLRATGAWDLPHLWEAWTQGGLAAVDAILTDPADQLAVTPRAGQRSAAATTPAEPGSAAPGRIVGLGRDDGALTAATEQDLEAATGLPTGDRLTAAGPRRRGTREPEQSRKVWHSSPGSAGR